VHPRSTSPRFFARTLAPLPPSSLPDVAPSQTSLPILPLIVLDSFLLPLILVIETLLLRYIRSHCRLLSFAGRSQRHRTANQPNSCSTILCGIDHPYLLYYILSSYDSRFNGITVFGAIVKSERTDRPRLASPTDPSKPPSTLAIVCLISAPRATVAPRSRPFIHNIQAKSQQTWISNNRIWAYPGPRVDDCTLHIVVALQK